MLNSTINNDSTELRLNFAKGRYDDFRNYLEINCNEILLQNTEDVEPMWSSFKQFMLVGTENYVPKVKSFINNF